MTRNAGTLAALAVLSGAVVLAGCTGGGGRRPLPNIAAEPLTSGIEGAWVDVAGTGVTNFFDGRFETFATDSGQKLSEGTYQHRDQVLVEITGISIIRQTPVAFNCSVASAGQLNCTSSSGQQFVLTRHDGPAPLPVGNPAANPPAASATLANE